MINIAELFPNDPLDVLHRFTPTPFHSAVRIGEQIIQVASNDRLLLPLIAPEEVPSTEAGARSFFWKIVRDPHAVGPLDAPIQFSVPGGVTAVFLGSACLIAVDREQSQLVSFVGAEVDAKNYRELVLPILSQLSNGDLIRQDIQSNGLDIERDNKACYFEVPTNGLLKASNAGTTREG
jgi:hypothetical protein